MSFSHAFGILSMLANPYRVSLFSKCARPLKPPTGTGRSEDVIAMSAAAAVRIAQSPPTSRHAAYATIRAVIPLRKPWRPESFEYSRL